MLTEGQVERIRRTSFEILEKVGFKALHAGARKMLKSAGATPQPVALSDNTVTEIEQIKTEDEKELVCPVKCIRF